MTTQSPATAELKSDSGSGFERKTQNPAGVDPGTPDPWPPLVQTWNTISHFHLDDVKNAPVLNSTLF